MKIILFELQVNNEDGSDHCSYYGTLLEQTDCPLVVFITAMFTYRYIDVHYLNP